jgi:hypothetical protein
MLKFHAQHPGRRTDRETPFDPRVKRCVSISPFSFEVFTDSRPCSAAGAKVCSDKNDRDQPASASKRQLIFQHFATCKHLNPMAAKPIIVARFLSIRRLSRALRLLQEACKQVERQENTLPENAARPPEWPNRRLRMSVPLANVKPKNSSASPVTQVPRMIRK